MTEYSLAADLLWPSAGALVVAGACLAAGSFLPGRLPQGKGRGVGGAR